MEMRFGSALSSVLPGPLAAATGTRTVSMVRLQGVITATSGPVPRAVINISTVEDALRRAFTADRTEAVALMINSPGGSATQSALVADRIRQLAGDREVPVLAFC